MGTWILQNSQYNEPVTLCSVAPRYKTSQNLHASLAFTYPDAFCLPFSVAARICVVLEY